MAELGARIDLPVGQSVLFANEGLRLTFQGVTNDSRCPRSDNGIFIACAHAGTATITLRAERGDQAQTLTLVITGLNDDTTLKPGGDQIRATFAGYRVQLVRLAPQPTPGTPTPRLYTATLLVTKP